MRFGIGQWKDIIESGCLPGKTNAQMNIQLQRMLGQQSVAGGDGEEGLLWSRGFVDEFGVSLDAFQSFRGCILIR